jgi:hypothetical protein
MSVPPACFDWSAAEAILGPQWRRHSVDDAAELNDAAVARAFDDAPVVHGDGRIDQVTAERPQPRQNPVFVGSGEP